MIPDSRLLEMQLQLVKYVENHYVESPLPIDVVQVAVYSFFPAEVEALPLLVGAPPTELM